MSLSVEELDATVRSFYEGRGEVVSEVLRATYCMQADFYIAKASPANTQPGIFIRHSRSLVARKVYADIRLNSLKRTRMPGYLWIRYCSRQHIPRLNVGLFSTFKFSISPY